MKSETDNQNTTSAHFDFESDLNFSSNGNHLKTTVSEGYFPFLEQILVSAKRKNRIFVHFVTKIRKLDGRSPGFVGR